jgi:putative transposase
VRLAYHRASEARTAAWVGDQRRVSLVETSAMLTAWKKTDELAFLGEVSSVPLQQSLRHLQGAFTNFFERRARWPAPFPTRRGGSCAPWWSTSASGTAAA